MTKEALFALYEKLYFHEIEMREKYSARQQVPLAIIVAQLTLMGFMLNNLKQLNSNFAGILFVCLFCAAIISIVFAIWNFTGSWFNYEYAFLPSAEETEKYRDTLVDTYAAYDQRDKLVREALRAYIYKSYMKCSSINTRNNDKRSLFFHKTAKFLIISFICSSLSFVPFYFGNINR